MEDIELRSGGIELVRPVELVDLYFHAGQEPGTLEQRKQQLAGCIGVITARDILSANNGSHGQLVGLGLIEGKPRAASLGRPLILRDLPERDELAKGISEAQDFVAKLNGFQLVALSMGITETEYQDGWTPW